MTNQEVLVDLKSKFGKDILSSTEPYQMLTIEIPSGLNREVILYLKDHPKFDYNLVDYQAALGIEQLSKLGVILERKKKIATAYLQAVQNSRLETYFESPQEDTFQRFPILVSGQGYEEILRYFKSIHIGTQRTTDEPLHRVLEENPLEYPNAERLFQRGHCIPIYPNLTKDNVQRIATAIRRIY